MSHQMLHRPDRLKIVRSLLLYQLAGCVLLSALALWFGLTAAYSVFLGGLICLVPNCYFAYRAFKFRGARAAREIVRSFYVGEAGKLLLTAILFAIVFSSVKPLNALALFLGFAAIQLVNWLVPIMQHSRLRA